MKRLFALLILHFAFCIFNFSVAQSVLIVIAHPDDEAACAATIYKITKELNGTADIALITNGEGGYKYSTLAEKYYNLELTDEKIGRENLPRIRKTELMNAGKIIGIRNYFFLEQQDRKYTTDERDPLDTVWNIPFVKKRLEEIMIKGKYDFVFCSLPVPETHGHHKAAAMLALETVKQLSKEQRPVILGFSGSAKTDTVKTEFTQLKEYTITAVNKTVKPFVLDRTTKFGYKNTLDYKVIVNWDIAEHKSQGTMQILMNQDDYENFWFFKLNNDTGIEKTKKLFDALKQIPYPVKSY